MLAGGTDSTSRTHTPTYYDYVTDTISHVNDTEFAVFSRKGNYALIGCLIQHSGRTMLASASLAQS
jgi:hypothetical protein